LVTLAGIVQARNRLASTASEGPLRSEGVRQGASRSAFASRSSIQTGAWSLDFSQLRASRSTPANEPGSYFRTEQEVIDPQPGFACGLPPQGKNRSATKEHVGMSNIHGLAILLR
jgi:hypothetical protein